MEPLLSKTDDWTLDDLDALPDDGRRYEIVDGGLTITPSPWLRHEVVVAELEAQLRAACPSTLRVLGPLTLVMGRTDRIPDLLVVRADLIRRGPPAAAPEDVVLVVEVESRGSVTTDRITKFAEYAVAGIPSYWRIEPEGGPLLTAYRLRRRTSSYVMVGQWSADEVAELTEPFPVSLIPSTLV